MHRVTSILFVTVLLSPVALSLAGDDYLEARELAKEGVILPLEKILAQMAEAYPGSVLEVELNYEYGRYLYEIELLDEEGRVWELEYDAVNGELLEKEREE